MAINDYSGFACKSLFSSYNGSVVSTGGSAPVVLSQSVLANVIDLNSSTAAGVQFVQSIWGMSGVITTINQTETMTITVILSKPIVVNQVRYRFDVQRTHGTSFNLETYVDWVQIYSGGSWHTVSGTTLTNPGVVDVTTGSSLTSASQIRFRARIYLDKIYGTTTLGAKMTLARLELWEKAIVASPIKMRTPSGTKTMGMLVRPEYSNGLNVHGPAFSTNKIRYKSASGIAEIPLFPPNGVSTVDDWGISDGRFTEDTSGLEPVQVPDVYTFVGV